MLEEPSFKEDAGTKISNNDHLVEDAKAILVEEVVEQEFEAVDEEKVADDDGKDKGMQVDVVGTNEKVELLKAENESEMVDVSEFVTHQQPLYSDSRIGVGSDVFVEEADDSETRVEETVTNESVVVEETFTSVLPVEEHVQEELVESVIEKQVEVTEEKAVVQDVWDIGGDSQIVVEEQAVSVVDSEDMVVEEPAIVETVEEIVMEDRDVAHEETVIEEEEVVEEMIVDKVTDTIVEDVVTSENELHDLEEGVAEEVVQDEIVGLDLDSELTKSHHHHHHQQQQQQQEEDASSKTDMVSLIRVDKSELKDIHSSQSSIPVQESPISNVVDLVTIGEQGVVLPQGAFVEGGHQVLPNLVTTDSSGICVVPQPMTCQLTPQVLDYTKLQTLIQPSDMEPVYLEPVIDVPMVEGEEIIHIDSEQVDVFCNEIVIESEDKDVSEGYEEICLVPDDKGRLLCGGSGGSDMTQVGLSTSDGYGKMLDVDAINGSLSQTAIGDSSCGSTTVRRDLSAEIGQAR